MVTKDLKATLLSKKSSKGKDYICIDIQLTDDYVKSVFLDSAELALIKREIKLDEVVTSNEFPFEK